jgi:hypothetical protein
VLEAVVLAGRATRRMPSSRSSATTSSAATAPKRASPHEALREADGKPRDVEG